MNAPSHLVWIYAQGKFAPQLLYQTPGRAPHLDEGIKRCVIEPIVTLKPEDAGCSFTELSQRYPAPPAPEL